MLYFAMAIINNEREETFDWIFREFQKSVKESPFLAIIDEDGANIDFGEKWRKMAKSGEIEIDYEIR